MDTERIQVNSGHYASKNYDTFERMQSYLAQIKEIVNINPEQLLEIGVGNGFFSDYLRKKGFNITTCDIDEKLNPDKVGSVLTLPFSDNSFDLVVCFQVLEHLPFNHFSKALSEIKRVTKNMAIVSLPDVERCFKFSFGRNNSSYFKKCITIPRRKKHEYEFNGEHYWEIGKKEFSFQRICKEFESAGFSISRTYRVFENTYHRFFILEKSTFSSQQKFMSKTRISNLESWRIAYREDNLAINTFLKYIKLLLTKNV